MLRRGVVCAAAFAAAAAVLWHAQRSVWGFDFLAPRDWAALGRMFAAAPGAPAVPAGLVASVPAALAAGLALSCVLLRVEAAGRLLHLAAASAAAILAALLLRFLQGWFWNFDFLDREHWWKLAKVIRSGRLPFWEFLITFPAAALAVALSWRLGAPRLDAFLDRRAAAAFTQRRQGRQAAAGPGGQRQLEGVNAPGAHGVPQGGTEGHAGAAPPAVVPVTDAVVPVTDAVVPVTDAVVPVTDAVDTDVTDAVDTGGADAVDTDAADTGGGEAPGRPPSSTLVAARLRAAGYHSWENPGGAPGFAALGLRLGKATNQLVLVYVFDRPGAWKVEEQRWVELGGDYPQPSPIQAAAAHVNEFRAVHGTPLRDLGVEHVAMLALRGGTLEDGLPALVEALEAKEMKLAGLGDRTDGVPLIDAVLGRLVKAVGGEAEDPAIENYVAWRIAEDPAPSKRGDER